MLQDDDAYFDGGAARLAFGIPPPPKIFQYSETPCHLISYAGANNIMIPI
jgi:hypothetical protein